MTFTAKWGSQGAGDGQFKFPYGVAVDTAGNVYVADTANHRIQKFDSNGTLIAKWGKNGGAGGEAAAGSGNGEFWSPYGIAVDASGNVFVADSSNSRIQKFSTADGVTYSLVTKWGKNGGETPPPGQNRWGSGDGEFSDPEGVAVDSAGNIYVADTYNNRVQKFQLAADGVTYEFVTKWGTNGGAGGTSNTGSANGEFNLPSAIAVDRATNHVYVSDYNNNRIQKFTSAGAHVTTIGATGSADGQFQRTEGVAVDTAGNVYASDHFNNRVQKFTSAGVFITKLGGTAGSAEDGRFNFPAGLAVSSAGSVYVADRYNHRIQKLTDSEAAAASITIVEDAQPDDPQDFSFTTTGAGLSAFTLDDDTDAGSSNTKTFSALAAGSYSVTQGATAGWSLGDLTCNPDETPNEASRTVDITLTAGENVTCTFTNTKDPEPTGSITIVKDAVPNDPQDFTYTTTGLSDFSLDDDTDNTLANTKTFTGLTAGSYSVAEDETTGWTITGLSCDTGETPDLADRKVDITLAAGEHVTCTFTNADATPPAFAGKWGTEGTSDGQFATPHRVAVDGAGNVYVPDTNNHRIQKFSPTGVFITKWGSIGSADGQLRAPVAIAVDAAGSVYVTDSGNHRIQKFTTTDGATYTFAAKWGKNGGDGSSGTGAGQFNFPKGIAVSPTGNVYVADSINYRIQKFTTTDGLNYAFATEWGEAGSGDGDFQDPNGLAIDSAGSIYVADNFNHRIQKFTADGAFILKWGTLAQFNHAIDVATDGNDTIYVADHSNDRVQRFNSVGTLITKFGGRGNSDGLFLGPAGVAVDGTGALYVADLGNRRIQKFGSATPVATGSITLVEDAQPDDAQDFAFTTTGTGLNAFNLDDDIDPALTNSTMFNGVASDTYSITQTTTPGWSLTGLSCDNGVAPDLENRKIEVALAAGENVTCTFTNTKQTQITVIEDSVPDYAQDFAYSTTGSGLSSFQLDDDSNPTLSNTKTFTALLPGDYTITQAGAPGWFLAGLTCDTGESVDPSNRKVTINLAASEHATCTFTNGAGKPGKPELTSATPTGSGKANLAFLAPDASPVPPVDHYTATCRAVGVALPTATVSGSALRLTVGGMTNGNWYQCSVKAHNVAGYGPDSAGMMVRVGAPGAPGSVALAKGSTSGSIKVTWTAAAANASPVTGYSVTCIPPTGASVSVAATGSPRMVAGLTRTKTYRCFVQGINKFGKGPARESSTAILPK